MFPLQNISELPKVYSIISVVIRKRSRGGLPYRVLGYGEKNATALNTAPRSDMILRAYYYKMQPLPCSPAATFYNTAWTGPLVARKLQPLALAHL